MAIEDMMPDEQFIKKLQDVEDGKLSISELREEIIKEYAK